MSQVRKNENYILDITGMTHEGQGVGRVDGFTVFVDNAVKGEQIEARIIKVNKSYAVGKLLKVLKASSERAEPFCPVYKRCGGCSLQHMTYPEQLRFKAETVRGNLRRIGGLENVTVHETIGMSEPFKYRNKAQFPVGTVEGKPVIGFFARRSHEIIDSELCGIQDDISDGIRKTVREFIEENGISIYDENTGRGLLRHVMTRVGFRTGEVMVVLVINGRSFPKAGELITLLTGRVPSIKTVVLNINTKATNVILGEESKTLFGEGYITDYIDSFRFRISPLSFFQVNPIQTEVLYGKALEYAGLTGTETVFDLYCGAGTISLFLSRKAQKVIGVEVVEQAVYDARENARANGVTNAEFISGEAEKVIPELYRQGVRADVVVVDPPRKGCDQALLETMVDMQPKRMVYVSCNPSTLARDLAYLTQHGYMVTEVQPVDMFPWTNHVESIVLMTNCGRDKK